MREVLIIAGEASGDLHASGLATALKKIRPDLTLTGVGGARMESAGVALIERSDRMAVMGFVEVLRQVPRHYALLSSLKRRLRSGRVGLLVVIDYPGFNMKLAAAAAAAGVPVLYYITPQVWAWGAGRLAELARVVTRAAPILPFEETLLRSHGIDATFVGHPLLDRVGEMPDRHEARRLLGLRDEDTVLALFPGSRAQEIHLAVHIGGERRPLRRLGAAETAGRAKADLWNVLSLRRHDGNARNADRHARSEHRCGGGRGCQWLRLGGGRLGLLALAARRRPSGGFRLVLALVGGGSPTYSATTRSAGPTA